jgi:hypothetical protein
VKDDESCECWPGMFGMILSHFGCHLELAVITLHERETRIDLLVSNVGLPGVDGRQLSNARLQCDLHSSPIRVVYFRHYFD